MEGFFNIKLTVWKRVLVTRSIAILPALAVAFMHDFDEVDTYLNILQSIQLPFAMVPWDDLPTVNARCILLVLLD